MSVKHKLKMGLREGWARLLYHTGLHRVVDALMPRRMTILTSHCVTHPSNDFLPRDMKIEADRLARLLDDLRRHYDLVAVGDGWERLQAETGRSMVALTMDDGYRDNREVLLPMLRERGISATVYLESRPLERGEINWTHKYFWILARRSFAELVEQYVELSEDETARRRLREELAAGGDSAYRLKKVLKYEADQADCERTLTRIFEAAGGAERELCKQLYLSFDDAAALRAGGVELGGHTVHHWVLSGLDADGQAREVAEGRQVLENELGGDWRSFAYPFGRKWDWNAETVEAVRQAGFVTAATTHAGTNTKGTDPLRLARWMIDDDFAPHLLVTEACGGFELLRRLGLDLSE